MVQQTLARYGVGLIAGLSISLLGSCDDSPTAVPAVADLGYVSVHTVASGRWIPEGELQVLTDGDPSTVRQVGLNGSLELRLPPGDHVIELFRGMGSAFYPECSVDGGLEREIHVQAGQVVPVQFELYCEVTLALSATTSGPNPDPDGYRVLVGPGYVTDSDFDFPAYSVPLDRALVFDRQSPFWWTNRSPRTWIYLWGVAQNCTLLSPNPLIVETGGELTERQFATECVDAPASTGTIFFLDQSQVYSVQADGTGLAQITNGPTIRHWSLSPDGSELVFSPWSDGGVFRVGTDGTGLTRIAPDDDHPDQSVQWGVDGRILFSTHAADGEPEEVFSMLADGSDRRRLTTGGGGQPSLSPDGTKIAFVGPDGLALMNPDGSGVAPLGAGVSGYRPKWSPDGSALAALVIDEAQFQFQVTIVDPSTGELSYLTATPLQSPADFAWSPDGDRVVYVAREDGTDYPVDYSHQGDLFTVATDGRRLARLTNLNLRMAHLDWRD